LIDEGWPFFVVPHHIWIDFGHFLGDQTVSQRVRAVVVLGFEQGHRTQLEQHVGGVAHVGDLFLEAARGGVLQPVVPRFASTADV
jgi:hypothetical protein